MVALIVEDTKLKNVSHIFRTNVSERLSCFVSQQIFMNMVLATSMISATKSQVLTGNKPHISSDNV